jgi:hypothetical protein
MKRDEFNELIKICKENPGQIPKEFMNRWKVYEIAHRCNAWGNVLGFDKTGSCWFYTLLWDLQGRILEPIDVLIIYSEKGKKEMIENFGEKYKELACAIAKFKFNCNQKHFLISSIAYYNSNGSLIESKKVTQEIWNLISPGSIVEVLFKRVCKSKKK